MSQLLSLRIVDGPIVPVMYAFAVAAFLASLLLRPSGRWTRRSWALTAISCLVGGAGIGFVVTWLLADVDNAFGVDLTPVTRAWVAVAFSGVAVAVAGSIRARRGRVALSALAIVAVVACSAMSINIDFGAYQTVRAALGLPSYRALATPIATPRATAPPSRPTIADWIAPAGMPAAGSIGTVSIPGVVSGFAARDAVVYLPPAALTADPPLLPVLIVLSGQPGVPGAPLETAHLREALDAFAAQHRGLAPIVVSPDQLGQPDQNPMCVDGPLGNSARYLTVDVVNWIKSHLAVLGDAAHWGLGGLSQGGTCAIQLVPAHPELFSGLIDASGQVAPTLGSVEKTIATGFSGDAAAYEAATPLAIFAAHKPMTGQIGIFGVGADDTAYKDGIKEVYAAAAASGMTAYYHETPGAAHDATAWADTFAVGMRVLATAWGLAR